MRVDVNPMQDAVLVQIFAFCSPSQNSEYNWNPCTCTCCTIILTPHFRRFHVFVRELMDLCFQEFWRPGFVFTRSTGKSNEWYSRFIYRSLVLFTGKNSRFGLTGYTVQCWTSLRDCTVRNLRLFNLRFSNFLKLVFITNFVLVLFFLLFVCLFVFAFFCFVLFCFCLFFCYCYCLFLLFFFVLFCFCFCFAEKLVLFIGKTSRFGLTGYTVQCWTSLRGYCTPGPYFWRLCAISQKIKQLRGKYPMDLVRNVPRN